MPDNQKPPVFEVPLSGYWEWDMTGYEATTAIRAMDGRYLDLPVIALTASALLDKEDKIIASGINDYISKPFKPEELYDKISYYTAKQTLQ